ncbi:MAG TPA: hypothetical protein VNF68_13110 [Candidatus Baltobacteraceae bacterium]|nr:hypothetical protein [Candidatus Baltobacteraceae bacterium]
MKLVTAFAFVLALLPVALGAQEATPTPNPLVYADAAMHCRIPDGWYSGGRRFIPLNELGDDPVPVAQWITKVGDRYRKIVLQQQHFEGTLDVFEATLEQQIRGESDDGVVRGKERISLKNGMPAYFITTVAGSGFTTSKSFIVGWIDGQRGIALILTAQIGDIDDAGAKQVLSDCSAVQYPADR